MNLFAWQYPYEIQWAEEDNVLYIRSGRGKKQFWLPPFTRHDGSFTKGILRMHEWFDQHGYPFLMKGVTPEAAERIRALCPDCYNFTPDRDNYEYVYLTQNLINLSGKKYRQKKNNLNHFRNQYIGNWEYVPITKKSSTNASQRKKIGMISTKDLKTTKNSRANARPLKRCLTTGAFSSRQAALSACTTKS